MFRHCLVRQFFLSLLAFGLVWSAASPAVAERTVAMEEVLVVGKRPGPQLWKVERGGHVLWLFGTLDPLPASMHWDEASVDHILSESAVLLTPPALSSSSSNPLKLIGLLRQFNRLKKLPKRQTLQDVLEAKELAVLESLAEQHGSSARSWRRLRPMFAAEALMAGALRRAGLETSDRVEKQLRRLARKHDVTVVPSALHVRPDAVIRMLSEINMQEDRKCLDTILRELPETLAQSVARAKAWSDGDMQALNGFRYPDRDDLCSKALLVSEEARAARHRAEKTWIKNASDALKSHKVSFAYLEMRELLADDGLRRRLEHRLGLPH